MINDRLIKYTKYILVTILAIFCVYGNVSAAVRNDLADSQDVVTSTTNSGTVASSGNTKLNGTSCSLFNVSVDHNASKTNNSKNAAGKFVGPYIDNQGNMVYKVVGAGNGCSGSYVAFCLDPNFDGVKTGQTLQYKAEQVDPNSIFGKRIYALYKIYQQNGSPTDDYNYFSYEVAARILAVKPDSDYQSRSNTAKSRFNSHLGVYQSGSVGGNNNGAALAAQAMSMAEGLQDVMNSTLGLSLNQVGGSSYDGSSYSILVNANIENCPDENCYGATVSGIPGQQVSTSWDPGARIKTITYSIDGLGTGECFSMDINATLNYDASNDVRNAMQISPVDATFDDRQNYIVFGSGGGGGGEVHNSLPISNCGPTDCPPGDPECPDPDPEPNPCPSDAELACTEDDENFVVINEGSQGGGGTDWENCIIGHTDSQGNSYDVVNTTKLYREQAADQKTIDQNALYDRTDAILGYTSDNSGGGSISGDAHSIDDSDFCVISCKEKYAFILPGNKKTVKQGTYFSFQVNHDWEKHAVVGVSAERTCVSNGIKNGAFNSRVLDLRKQQVDFYNMYLYYKQLYNAMYSKEAMDKYKADSAEKPVEVTGTHETPDPAYNIEIKDRTFDQIKNETDEFADNNYIESWDGGGIKVNVRYCKLDDPNNLNSKINCDYTKSVPINATFASNEGIGTSNLQIPKKDFNFYSQYYPDKSFIWSTNMHVATYDDNYQGDLSKYILSYDGRKIETTVTNFLPTGIPYYSKETSYGDHHDDTYYAKVRYLKDYKYHKNEWSDYNKDSFVYKKYNEAMGKLKDAYEAAKAKYDSLNAQIGIQSDSMQECTNYLDNFSQEKNPYRFDPIITFSYDGQPTYMQMLAPNRLENMNEGVPQVNYEKYFCGGGICLGGGGEATPTNFQFGNIYNIPDSSLINSVSEAKDQNVQKKFETDVTEYYNVGSVGSRSTFGRFNADGSSGCSSSYRNDAGSRGDYCYEFYQSAKQFFTQAPDGIVTTTPSGENKTILSTDGRVYPVAINTPEGKYDFRIKFANIGQFNESTSLGRIMGGGDGKQGTMSGDYGDTEVCYYEVCRVDDPDCNSNPCPPTDPNYPDCDKKKSKCEEIVKNKCNNGSVADPQSLSDYDYEKKCLVGLMNAEEDCCSYVEKFKDIRTGKWAKVIPTSIWSKYSKECDKSNACTSFTIISSDYTGAESNLSDISGVNNDGALQVNARAVSLNNLFPNSEKGINWLTSEAKEAMVEIESVGEGIFANDCRNSNDSKCRGLDYSAVIDSKCADQIRQYNLQQEGQGSGYGNGGFNDYTNSITNAHTDLMSRGDITNHTYGQTAEMDASFRKMVEAYCKFEGKAAPDLIVDNSSLVLEPWQYPEKFVSE